MEGNIDPATADKSVAPPDYYLDKKRRKIDFWIGFGGGILGNILFGLIIFLISPLIGRTTPENYLLALVISIGKIILNLLPWVANIIAIIMLLVFHRKWIVFGLLAVYGVGLVLAIIAGLVLTAICFSSGGL